jgi:uncharacterized protein YyaL (SSP411 family)
VNRLAQERSPYLLQHAANPVDWFPWSEEAFAKARTEDKPVFLSIGYSTCHWCHVMEHESFENPAVAAVLNDHFVSIKVDREERPDVDRVYMTFVQATTGSGGWPMSVWLTPDLKPFYGGTYYPPASKWGRPGFVDILQEIARVWGAERGSVQASADSIASDLMANTRAAAAGSVPGDADLRRTAGQFTQNFDRLHGGFGDAPKFPRPAELLFLLREHARTGAPELLAVVVRTLDAIARGGVRDHVGGGFHRYSVDAAWRVPHFEKMLYDQAQLVLAFVEAAQASGHQSFLDVAEDTLHYVMREMTDSEGGFYSAEDADSVPPEEAGDAAPHQAEGAFYLWRASELDVLLGADAAVAKRRFGVEANGNAPADPHQEFVGKNLLFAAVPVATLADETGASESDVVAALARARLAMFGARSARPRPHRDDKVLTAWNGLMIAAFARTARVVRAYGPDDRPAGQLYLDAARAAARFIRRTMWREDTRTLLRRYRDGDASIEAFAEDYACLIFGLLELFQSDPDPSWFDWVQRLQDRQNELFWDDADGAWFSTTGQDPRVLLRVKDDYDGAEPSASSISVLNLLTLGHLGARAEWLSMTDRALRAFGARLTQAGRAVPMMAAALAAHTAGPQQIVIVLPPGEGTGPGGGPAGPLERTVGTRYLPFAFTLVLTAAQRDHVGAALPLIGAMTPVDGKTAAYVCRNFMCRQPVTTPDALAEELAAGVSSLVTNSQPGSAERAKMQDADDDR